MAKALYNYFILTLWAPYTSHHSSSSSSLAMSLCAWGYVPLATTFAALELQQLQCLCKSQQSLLLPSSSSKWLSRDVICRQGHFRHLWPQTLIPIFWFLCWNLTNQPNNSNRSEAEWGMSLPGNNHKTQIQMEELIRGNNPVNLMEWAKAKRDAFSLCPKTEKMVGLHELPKNP